MALLFKNGVREFQDFGAMGLRLSDLESQDVLEGVLGAVFMLNLGRNDGLERVVPVRIDFTPGFIERATTPLAAEDVRIVERKLAASIDPTERRALSAWLEYRRPWGHRSAHEMLHVLADSYRAMAELARQRGKEQAARDAEALADAAELQAGPADGLAGDKP